MASPPDYLPSISRIYRIFYLDQESYIDASDRERYFGVKFER